MDKKEYKEGIFGLEATVEGPSASASSLSYRLEDAVGRTVLRGEQPIKSRGLSNFIAFEEQRIPDVKPWSAEHPNLYTLVLELKNPDGRSFRTDRLYGWFPYFGNQKMDGSASMACLCW